MSDPLTLTQRRLLVDTLYRVRGRMTSVWDAFVTAMFEARDAYEHVAVVSGNPHDVLLEELLSNTALTRKGEISLAANFPTVAAVRQGWLYEITAVVTDNNATKTNTGQTFSIGDRIVWDGTSAWVVLSSSTALVSKGDIGAAADFPTAAVVRTGYAYLITADVIDNDATKTNTGLVFTNGDRIIWNGTTWKIIGSQFSFVEKSSIGAAADFPTVAAVRRGNVYLISADVTDDDGTKTNTGTVFAAGDRIVWNGSAWSTIGSALSVSGPFKYKGGIAAAADFPTATAVKPGWYYTVTVDCTDNNPAKTNTGVSVNARDEIVWSGSTWINFGAGRLHAGSHVTGGDDVIPSAISGGNAGLMTGADKAAHDTMFATSQVTGVAGGAVGANRLVKDSGGKYAVGSVADTTIVGVNLSGVKALDEVMSVGLNGMRTCVAADAIVVGDYLKAAEDGMVIKAITPALASVTTGSGVGGHAANQPANDQITIESTDAADTNVPLELIGSTHGGVVVVSETKGTDPANGTTPVDTVKADWGLLLAVKKPVTAGDIVIKEKSGGLTIVTIPAANTSWGVVEITDSVHMQHMNTTPVGRAEAATTKFLAVKYIGTTGTTDAYMMVQLNGAANQQFPHSARSVTELYVGDVENARTPLIMRNPSPDSSFMIIGKAVGAQATRGSDVAVVLQ